MDATTRAQTSSGTARVPRWLRAPVLLGNSGVRRLRSWLAKRIEPKPANDPAWEVPIDLGLKGAQALRDRLPIRELDYLRVAGSAMADARAYVIYTALDEVQKTAMYFMRLRDFFDQPIDPKDTLVSRLVFSQVLEEQRARERRLLEVLLTVVLFTTTNEQPYFRHLLLLEELDDLVGGNADLEEFHGARSANVDYSIDRVLQRITETCFTINDSRCWYAKAAKPNRTALRAGGLLSSMRVRLKTALPIMTAQEKLLVGLSYAGYSEASESIHYSVHRNDFRLRAGQERRNFASLGILIFAILNRCHELLGRPAVPIIDQMLETLSRSSPELEDSVRRHTARATIAGDFVLADGYLSEVLTVQESKFGYRSYEVRYLVERPIADIETEWIPARYIQILVTRDRAMADFREAVKNGQLPSEVGDRLESLPSGQLQQHLRNSVITTWNAGLREWVKEERRRRTEIARSTE